MATVKITVTNSFLHGVVETFITRVDVSDMEEVLMAAGECCGQYLDMHEHTYSTNCPDVEWDIFADNCDYTIEEIINNEL